MSMCKCDSENKVVVIDGGKLTLKEFVAVARYNAKVEISDIARANLDRAHKVVRDIVDNKKVVYGISTGFGKFSSVTIDTEDLETLQENLIISHAVGVGNPLAEEIVRGMLVLRVNAICKGHSGARPEVVQCMVDMLNKGVIPVVPEKGSLGASGDLAPLSHMILVMIGRGEAFYQGKKISGKEAMDAAGIKVIRLAAKEGLALINGTQVMTSIGALAVFDAENLVELCDMTCAMTVDALSGLPAAFDPRIHEVRNQSGQMRTASNLLKYLEGSQIIATATHGRVQDAYALRCTPQIHGASRDAIAYVKNIVEIEMNAVTDNPIIFPNEGDVISGGNFHGQPVALAMDFLGIALAELANISERRLERLVNPALSNDLPAFLSPKGGLNSGFMIVQYSAASLVSENKVLAHPASVDSIPSSANQEDHVSMGTIGARKAREILENATDVVSMEIMGAAQGIDLRGGEPGKGSKAAYNVVRKYITSLEEDRELRLDITAAQKLVRSGEIQAAVYEATGCCCCK